MPDNDNERRPQTVAELEVAGMRLGISIAQRLMRGYGDNPLLPDRPTDVLEIGQLMVDRAVIKARAEAGLNHLGEEAWRKGYARGLTSQLENPTSEIRIKVVKA